MSSPLFALLGVTEVIPGLMGMTMPPINTYKKINAPPIFHQNPFIYLNYYF
jgi:hypothetical protein